MKIINAKAEIITPIDGESIMKHIEQCGRVCYKSETKTTDESAKRFIKNIINRSHESVLEHFNITAKFTVDRGVSHEIVRHRIASYSQESTRYCNYNRGDFGSEITVIQPIFFKEGEIGYECWKNACKDAESAYFELLKLGCSPQEARSVLPNSLKTELIMTCNIREWRHFLKLRTAKDAHPQMRQVANMILRILKEKLPVIFEDIKHEI